ncbi:MAG: HD-GYP domain-containing protein [Actinomycetota bacterium]
MNEHWAGVLLAALRRAVTIHRLYGPRHPLVGESCAAVAEAAAPPAGEARRCVLTLIDGALYLDRWLLPAVSLAFDGFLQALQDHQIESLTFCPPVEAGDVAHLVAALSGDKPAGGTPGGTILVNEAPWTREQLQDWENAPSRSAYASSLHALRSLGLAVQKGEHLDMSQAANAVGSLLDLCVREPASALLLSTMKSHHEYTFYHSVNTCILALAMGRLAGLGDPDLVLLGMGAMLHDIGKLGVSPAVLQHPGRLSPEQRWEIEQHPLIGAEAILSASEPGQEVVATVALEHHARYDGTGYPVLPYVGKPPGGGSDGPPLHLYSRLVAVADAYDALTSRRSYRRAEAPPRALHVLLDGMGRAWDPDAVLAFIHLMGVHPPGSLLRLRDGRVVTVTGPAQSPGASPPAVVVIDAAGRRRSEPEPVVFDPDDVVDLLTPGQVDVQPAALLAGTALLPSPTG